MQVIKILKRRCAAMAISQPWKSGLGAAMLAVGGGACTVGPNYTAPRATTPAQWLSVPASTAGSSLPANQRNVVVVSNETANLACWWTILSDPTLDSLLKQAEAQNFDLKVAIERVNQARAQRRIASSEFYPNLNAIGDYQRSRTSPNSPIGEQISKHSFSDWLGGIDATWEIDLFGRIRRNTESAKAGLQAMDEARQDVLVRLLAETARDYVALRGAQRRLAVAADTLKSERDTFDLVTARRAVGSASDLDVSKAAADVHNIEAAIPALQADIDESIFSIAALLGVPPAAVYDQLVEAGPIPVPDRTIAIGLPSELLRRRPDIREAERQLAAATAHIGVAVADYYPRISLTGSFVMDATKFTEVGNWNSREFGVGPTVAWNLFDAGNNRNQVRFAKSQQREAFLYYQKAVVDSLKEVELAISRYANERLRRESLVAAVTDNERAISLAKARYEAGSIDLLQVLDTQRNLFASQDQLAQCDTAITTDLVALYKSLGGGWENGDPAPAGGLMTSR